MPSIVRPCRDGEKEVGVVVRAGNIHLGRSYVSEACGRACADRTRCRPSLMHRSEKLRLPFLHLFISPRESLGLGNKARSERGEFQHSVLGRVADEEGGVELFDLVDPPSPDVVLALNLRIYSESWIA